MKNEQENKPWYREPYVWLLIALPMTTVIASIITARLAIESNDGLVVDDYYKKGMEINLVLERDRNAENLGIKADIQLAPENNTFRILLTGQEAFEPPEDISVSFLHSTRSGFDRQMVIKKTGVSLYQAPLPELVKGRWHIQIETNEWRILKTVFIQ